MVSVDEVPEYAGLIYINEYGRAQTVKLAPKLHKIKIDPNGLKLLDKFYYNMISAKNKVKELEHKLKKLTDKDYM